MATVPLQANNRIWLTYQHFPYKAWNAVAEMVDNSVQSYLDNKTALDQEYGKDKDRFFVRIDYSSDEIFSIWDNAMGMDLTDLNRAVQLAAPPPNRNGRSEFGMGMKTSCCWLGGRWTVISKKLGNDTEYSVTIDVEAIAASDSPIPCSGEEGWKGGALHADRNREDVPPVAYPGSGQNEVQPRGIVSRRY